ncbi:MAG: glycogen-binding domain-containing protein [Candidatus Krumholzibacteriales bacterium]
MNLKRRRKKIKTVCPRGAERRRSFFSRTFLFLAAAAMTIAPAIPAQGGVKMLDSGKVQFSYYDPYAGKVYLAGSFNNWNTTATPMNKDDEGYWKAALDLDPGEHEYKFVVDEAWITDQENPNTKADPYGGTNSVVEISSSGEIVISGETQAMSANTALSPNVHYSGRFLLRSEASRGREYLLLLREGAADEEEVYISENRWRLQRPAAKIDMNFDIMISDIVHGYTRLRIDSEKDFLEPNNISAILDEAHIDVTPGQFELRGYYSEEVLQSSDPSNYFGDLDLPGTIFDEHLKTGKGTSGVTGSFSSYGVDFEGFLANVHDYDIYNDPDIYDNTGTDLYYGRLTRKFREITLGGNFLMRRNVWWLNFTDRVGADPVNTGIEKLDEHINRTGDPSDWFEMDDKRFNYGLDLSAELFGGDLNPRLELLTGKKNQRFVTANSFGIDLGNAPIDVPIMEQDNMVYHGGLTSTLIENLYINAEHTRNQFSGASEDETALNAAFRRQVEANKQIYFTVEPDPAALTHDYSELYMKYDIGSGLFDGMTLKLWLQRNMYDYDKPGGQRDLWHYNYSVSSGASWQVTSDFDFDIEQNYLSREGSEALASGGSEFEIIARCNYKFTDKLSAFANIRTIHMEYENAGGGEDSGTFTSPFAGFSYTPAARVSVLLAYGLDPLDFSIDYDGRRIGRYLFRNEYLYQNPGTTMMDAEEALADLQVITLRAVFNF